MSSAKGSPSRRAINQRYREGHRDQVREIQRRWRQTESGKAADKRYRYSKKGRATEAAYRARRAETAGYRLKMNARQRVYTAKKSGTLIEQPCWCSSPKVEAHHHNGYANPLDVVWLCNLHHKQAHKRLL